MALKFMLLSALFIVAPTLSARILGYVPTPSYSHQIVFYPLWRELSLRGHQLTVLTTDPMNDPSLTNLTEIDLHNSYEMWDKMNLNKMAELNIVEMFNVGLAIADDLLDEQLEHPKVKALIKNQSEYFDLLMVEGLWPAASAFSARFNCPYIMITSLDAPAAIYDTIGNPTHPVLNPDFMLPFSGELTFLERLASTAFYVFSNYYHNRNLVPMQNLLLKKHFGDDYPHLKDILKNPSILFVNTDSIFHQIRPLLPNVVQIGGGTHLKPPQPLPKDLQKHLDAATEGFIYFSLGSNIKSKELSNNTLKILLETFAELPYKVLWKFELEDLPGKPDNVIISKWYPQQDIFRHPKIKLFITQGGLQSMEEAIYNHIPIVGMPFIGDQPSNVNKIVAKGLGLAAQYTTMDKTSLKNTILEVMNNPKYRNKVRELAELAKDQPMTGLERAIWWTEYVLRHKGAKHLKSPASDLPVYQYFLLDVIGFCVLVLFVVFYVLVKSVKLVFKLISYFKSAPKVKVH